MLPLICWGKIPKSVSYNLSTSSWAGASFYKGCDNNEISNSEAYAALTKLKPGLVTVHY